MKIAFHDNDPRKITDAANYADNHGPFAEIAIKMNNEFNKLGYYSEEDEADYVGICDGLNVGFQYKDKKSFVINVWETANTLPYFLLQAAQGRRLFGLSEQITNLWHKYGRIDVRTINGGCDTSFWNQTLPKSEKFTFLHVNSSNVRSGIDLTINAFYIAFNKNPNVRLIIKDTNNSSLLKIRIDNLVKEGCNIEYISKRMSSLEIRDLYSISHVCLNVIRSTSFGLPLLESSACNCLCVTGDTPPTNELIKDSYGVLLKPCGLVSLNEFSDSLEKELGLLNCYPKFQYPEEPLFYNFSWFKYAELIKKIFDEWDYYKTINTRQPIIDNWGWEKPAKRLIEFLSK